jgi:hypothetical protein
MAQLPLFVNWLIGSPTVIDSTMINGNVGFVRMIRQPQSYTWSVFDGTGAAVSTSGTTSQGLQEAINTAASQGLPLYVEGGGQTTVGGVQTEWSRITSTTTINIPAGTHAYYSFRGVGLVLNTGANDGLVFDSQDMLRFNFDGQIVYTGTGNCVRFLPTNANQESFTGMTSSTVEIGSTVCAVSAANLAVDNTKGVCFRISSGTHTFINSRFIVGEANGGLVGFQIDNPSSAVNYNLFIMPAIHGFGTTGMVIGTSAGGTAIYGNIFDAIGGAGATNFLSDWGMQNIYRLSVEAGNNGIVLNSSAAQNIYEIARNNAATPISDSSTAKNSVFIDANGGSITAPDIYSNDSSFLIRSKATLNNGAGAATGTLTNAPAGGNPTKWISIDDNGTTRKIPAW